MCQGFLDQQDATDCQEFEDYLDHPDHRVIPERTGSRERSAHLGPRATRAGRETWDRSVVLDRGVNEEK